MNRFLQISACLVMGAVLSPLNALAGGVFGDGFYFALRGGATFGDLDVGFTSPQTNGVILNEDLTDTGGVVGGAFGHTVPGADPWRVELEVMHRANQSYLETFAVDPAVVAGGGSITENIEVNSTSFMAKGIFEIKGDLHSLFAQVGIGGSLITYDVRETTTFNMPTMLNPDVLNAAFESDDSFDFTWSIGAGVTRKISKTHVVEVMYEYVHSGSVDFNGMGGPNQASPNNAIDLDVTSHNIVFGYRFH